MIKKEKEPRILQIMPVHDVYCRCDNSKGGYFYDKAIAMALVEYYSLNEPFQGIRYLFRHDIEYIDFDLIESTDDIFFYDQIKHLLTTENT